ncbi:DUF3018 family protein [Mycobacterium heidelbergense]|nr:antitoxin MazE-like protein [Mycobacterium heidelbergense]MCV7050856.1 DUF3018 family protein [Mycobacterium heidelbergense]
MRWRHRACGHGWLFALGAATTADSTPSEQRPDELRARPLDQVWVPDVRSERFATEAHREALALVEADRHNDDMDFVEAISELVDHE